MKDNSGKFVADAEILEDFARWYKELPHAAAPLSGDEEAADWDLATVLAESAALRREVALQNREQSKSIRQIEQATGVYRKSAEEFSARGTEIAQLRKQAASDAEDGCLTRFLDVMDALERGQAAVNELRRTSWLIGRKSESMEAVADGYDMAIRRMTRLLADYGVRPVETKSVDFDPNCMNAIETRTPCNADDEAIAEVFQVGYRRRGKILRFAEVAVNRKKG